MDLLAAENESEPLMVAIAEVWNECEGLSHAAFALAFLKYASASAVMHEAETGEGAEWALKVLNGLIGNARQAQMKGRLESDLSIH